jgi:hypothetical protein
MRVHITRRAYLRFLWMMMIPGFLSANEDPRRTITVTAEYSPPSKVYDADRIIVMYFNSFRFDGQLIIQSTTQDPATPPGVSGTELPPAPGDRGLRIPLRRTIPGRF